MAKDKKVELAYKIEGVRRKAIRKENRVKNFRRKKENKENGICPYCDCSMTWCDGCNMWSSKCCQEYGSCECS